MIKAWISPKLSNGCIYGWLFDTDNREHRDAIIQINGSSFAVHCNEVRSNPARYPLYKDFGFRLRLDNDFINMLPSRSKLVLIDKQTNLVVRNEILILTSKNDPIGIKKKSTTKGKLYSKFKDLRISGWVVDPSDVNSRIVQLKINENVYECVASKYCKELNEKGLSHCNHEFTLLLPIDDVLKFPKFFTVELFDKLTHNLLDSKEYKSPKYLLPHNFNEYLSYSMVNPLVYAPYDECHKRCFAYMENIASSLECVELDALCSVIMPVFNREECVIDSINSVLSQSYSNFELIIIDDGSTDRTYDVISCISDDRVKIYRHEKNRGVSFSRNEGLMRSKGDYIFYLDSDNTWDERFLRVMLGAFCKIKNADALYCGQYLYKYSVKESYAVRFAAFNKALLENRNYIDLNCFGHSRRTIGKVKFNESLSRLVDYDYILRINAQYTIVSVPVLLSNYYYCKAKNTITTTEKFPNIFIPKNTGVTNFYRSNANVSAVIPNYEDIDSLKRCISSLKLNNVSDIIVIDNNSNANVVAELEDIKKLLGFRLIKNKVNYGFTYAVNQGLKLVPSGYDVIIANNDVCFSEGAVSCLSSYAYSLNNVGLVFPRQILSANNASITSHVPYADVTKDCDVNLSIHFMNIVKVPLFSDGKVIELSYAPFCSVYIKRDVLDMAGELDAEHGRHYRSDRLYCEKIRNELGLNIYYVSDAIVYHKHQSSSQLLKHNNLVLYKNMYERNCWSDEEMASLGFKQKDWAKARSETANILGLISNSGFFDEAYYLKNYSSDISGTCLSPLLHYLDIGWKKCNNPSSLFDTSWYLNNYHSVKDLNICPLVHYLINGIKKEYYPNPSFAAHKKVSDEYSSSDIKLVSQSSLFDSKWYQHQYLKEVHDESELVRHYITEGWKKGFCPSKNFNGNLYLDLYSDVKKTGVCPLVHYLKFGALENRKIAPVFKKVPPTFVERIISKFKTKTPLISIVVASYNYENFIDVTLDSILKQTYKNYEVIIVDDGSTDNSVEIIKKYLKHNNFYLYFHENRCNRGLPETVRLGVEKAHGSYIAFCESDDYWDKDYLLEKVALISEYAKANVIINDVQLFGDNNKINRIYSSVASNKFKYLQNKTCISPIEFRMQNWILTFSCTMVKREVIKQCDFVNVPRKANLDWWLWRQICMDNCIYYIDKKLTFWRIHDSYMEADTVKGRLMQERFLSDGDRLLFHKDASKAKELSKYTDFSLTVINGELYRNKMVFEVQPKFSIILPTYNRANCIKDTIDSILGQSYQNFELIIVDDGSTDGTGKIINDLYADAVSTGKIVYIYKDNEGVCTARNIGLSKARYEWIVYVDSDNICSDIYLETFAYYIVNNPSKMAFYGRLVSWVSNKKIGEPFNIDKLLKENFIDLGVYCHNISIYQELGGFDEKMTRLVDWELIARYSKKYEPIFIDKVVLLYCDKKDSSRITEKYDLYDNYCYFRKKHCNYPMISTVITTYNHQKYIGEAIESAIVQMGEFKHEILISDDCSSDGTRRVIQSYIEKYPNLIRDISSKERLGISLNMQKCFKEAKGEFIAVLEGDDYWIEKYKLQRQLKFLQENSDCSMVFSRIKLLNNGRMSLLERQKGLPCKISGDDIIKEQSLNYIANFSSCLFRANIMKTLPKVLFNNRFNEIALSFYITKLGFIGYISQVMSVYRIHDKGVWSSLDKTQKLKSGLECRETALAVCDDKYKQQLKDIIERQYISQISKMEETPST